MKFVVLSQKTNNAYTTFIVGAKEYSIWKAAEK